MQGVEKGFPEANPLALDAFSRSTRGIEVAPSVASLGAFEFEAQLLPDVFLAGSVQVRGR